MYDPLSLHPICLPSLLSGLVNIEEDDEDLIDYVNSLRVAILEAYTGILTVSTA